MRRRQSESATPLPSGMSCKRKSEVIDALAGYGGHLDELSAFRPCGRDLPEFR